MREKQKFVLDPYSFLAFLLLSILHSKTLQIIFFPRASSSWYLPIASAYEKKLEPKKEPKKLNISSQDSVESPTRSRDTQRKDPHDFQDSQDPYS